MHANNLLPCFGNDLWLYEDCDVKKESYSNIGWWYDCPEGMKWDTADSQKYFANETLF